MAPKKKTQKKKLSPKAEGIAAGRTLERARGTSKKSTLSVAEAAKKLNDTVQGAMKTVEQKMRTPAPLSAVEKLTGRKAGETRAPSAKSAALAPVMPETAKVVLAAIDELGGQVELLEIKDAETNITGMTMLTQLKTMEKRLTEEREKLVKPLNQQVKSVNSLFKPFSTRLEAIDAALRKKVIDFRAAEELRAATKRIELMEKAQEAQVSGDQNTASSLAQVAVAQTAGAKTEVIDTGSVQFRGRWTFRVTDAGMIPLEYLVLDPKKVNAAIKSGLRDQKAQDGTVIPAIPGIEIFQSAELSVSDALPALELGGEQAPDERLQLPDSQ